MAIRYDRPTDEQRKEIWRSLFDKLEEDRRLGVLARQRGHPASNTAGRLEEEEANPQIIIPETTRDVALRMDKYPANFQLNGRDIRNSEFTVVKNITCPCKNEQNVLTAVKTVLLSAISVARYEALNSSGSRRRPTVIRVTAEQLERVLKNKEDFNNDYKGATGFSPDQMAAEKFLRAENQEVKEK